MKYYVATNTGKGFITHEDNEVAHIQGYMGDVWVTENEAWASRIKAVELTKEEAQTKVNLALKVFLAEQKALIDSMPESDHKTILITEYVELRDSGITLP